MLQNRQERLGWKRALRGAGDIVQDYGKAAALLVAGLMVTVCSVEAGAAPLTSATRAGFTHSDLIVMGEKSVRSEQDTPASVIVATEKSIIQQNLTIAYDILEQTPNVAVDGARTTFSIRGIDAFNVSGNGDGSLASVFVDGASIPRLALAAAPLDLFDVAQVEVFRGPQSTIQGRNVLAGAVIISSHNPSFDWTGRARIALSNERQESRAGVAFGGPLIQDQVAFRLAGEVSRANGLIRNITMHERADKARSTSLRGKLLFTPRAFPGLRVIGGLFLSHHQRGTFYSELDPPYDRYDRISTADVPDVKHTTNWIGSITLLYDLGAGSSLTSSTNISQIRFRSQSDADRTASPGQLSRIDDPTRTFQQEIRLNFHRPGIEGIAGVFFLHQQEAYHFDSIQSLSLAKLGLASPLQAAGISSATIDTVFRLYDGIVSIRNSSTQSRRTENIAAFTDLTLSMTSRSRLHLGLRYDLEWQERASTQVVALARALPDPDNLAVPSLGPIVVRLNDLLFSLAQGATSAGSRGHVSYHAWLPKTGVSFDLNRNMTLSFTAQRGYRAGGNGFNDQRAENYSFAPEWTTNFETSLRSQWFDKRWTLNANAFWTDWTDQQVAVQLTPGSSFDTQVVNVGKSRLYGFEIETRAELTPALNVYAGAGLSRARFTGFTSQLGDTLGELRGKQFPRAPRWTIAGGASLALPGGPFANINANYRSAYFQSVMDQRSRDIRSRILINAKLGWRGKRLSAYLTTTNILNVQRPDQFFIDVDGRRRGTLNAPRTFGLSFESQI